MKLHVLPGDAYVETFRETGVEGELAIFRECFVEGDLQGETLDELWHTRERYLSGAYPDSDKSYDSYVVHEINKLLVVGEGDNVYLWFEYELFCSVNYWFCLHLLRDAKADVHRVAPTVRDEQTKWRGFGRLSAEEMLTCWNDRVKVSRDDLERGGELWLAFKSGDRQRVAELGAYESQAFPHLAEVSRAASELHTKPKEILHEVIAAGEQDFSQIFPQFARRAGVFGLGDIQVKRIMEEMRSET